MATRTITECDGCGAELRRTADKFCNLHVKTDSFLDAAGSRDYSSISLVFCEDCTRRRLLPTLERLAEVAQ